MPVTVPKTIEVSGYPVSHKKVDLTGIQTNMVHAKVIAKARAGELSSGAGVNAAMTEIIRLGGMEKVSAKVQEQFSAIIDNVLERLKELNGDNNAIPGAANILHYRNSLRLVSVQRDGTEDVTLIFANTDTTANTDNYQLVVSGDQVSVYSKPSPAAQK